MSAPTSARVKKFDRYFHDVREKRRQEYYTDDSVAGSTQVDSLALEAVLTASPQSVSMPSIEMSMGDELRTLNMSFDTPNSEQPLSLMKKIMLAMGCFVFVVALAGLYMVSGPAGQNPSAVVAGDVLVDEAATLGVQTVGEPSELMPTSNDFFAYNVESFKPRYLRIPKLGIYTRIKPMDSTGNMINLPANIFDAGWFESGVTPGDSHGVAKIVGHVSGPTKDGVFANLGSLRVGDTVEVERGDGNIISYSVGEVVNGAPNPLTIQSTPGHDLDAHGVQLVATSPDGYTLINTQKTSAEQ